jgi:hypothetical protein
MPQGDARSWTNADAQRFQEAVYLTARVDEEQTVRENDVLLEGVPANSSERPQDMRMDTGIHGSTVHQYRDLLWGTDGDGTVNRPMHGGSAVDVYRLPQGHFVLGEEPARGPHTGGQARVAYDPWPRPQTGDVNVDRDADAFRRLDQTSDAQRRRMADESRWDPPE